MARITALPKDMSILNAALRQLDTLQQQLDDILKQVNAIKTRLKDANIP